jgi:hypothetical protein
MGSSTSGATGRAAGAGPAGARPAAAPAAGQRTGAPVDDYRAKLAEIAVRERDRAAWRNLWLAHHWPAEYHERCVRLGQRWVCRRCAALYPLALAVAASSAAGRAPWPARLDPWPIWLLSVPATVAYAGEATGRFAYRARWQVGTTLLAAVAFGRALGYELLDRWSPQLWAPLAVFGGVWFAATVTGRYRAATASSSSSSVL